MKSKYNIQPYFDRYSKNPRFYTLSIFLLDLMFHALVNHVNFSEAMKFAKKRYGLCMDERKNRRYNNGREKSILGSD